MCEARGWGGSRMWQGSQNWLCKLNLIDLGGTGRKLHAKPSLSQPPVPAPLPRACTWGTPWNAVLTSAGPPLTTPVLCSILPLLGHHCFGNHSLEGTLERRYCSPSLCSTVGKRKPFRSSYGSDQNTPEAAENINRWSSFSFLTTSF